MNSPTHLSKKMYQELAKNWIQDPETPRRWTVTGAAGFIGSHICEALLSQNQQVVAVDNFSTGKRENLALLQRAAECSHGSFQFLEGTIEQPTVCAEACRGADYVIHQAALGSVPGSIANPLETHNVNLTGTLNMLIAAREEQVKRFVFASSSAVYGNAPGLPKQEANTGIPLSPYASSKLSAEYYCRNFTEHYGLETMVLRYFNVFGPRQDPMGPYAAVIPRWIEEMKEGRPITINGDGETTRDFCFVANVAQANLLAATVPGYDFSRNVVNIALGDRITLNELQGVIRDALIKSGVPAPPAPIYGQERAGDVRHSQADISLAMSTLGYRPSHDAAEGLRLTIKSFLSANEARRA